MLLVMWNEIFCIFMLMYFLGYMFFNVKYWGDVIIIFEYVNMWLGLVKFRGCLSCVFNFFMVIDVVKVM